MPSCCVAADCHTESGFTPVSLRCYAKSEMDNGCKARTYPHFLSFVQTNLYLNAFETDGKCHQDAVGISARKYL